MECESALEYLAGYVDGDGLVYHDPRRGYELKVTDRECSQIEYIAGIISRCLGTKAFRIYRKPRYCYLRSYRKKVVTTLNSIITRLRTSPTAYYVGGLLDAEGDCTQSKARVRFTNSQLELVRAVSRYFEACGVKHHIYMRRKNHYTWYILEVYGSRQVELLLSCLHLNHSKWSACQPPGTPGAHGRGAYWA